VNNKVDILKGIHPGLFLDRELKKRKLSKGGFALSIREYPQTLSAILKGRRSMNTSLALRIEDALGFEEGLLMTLQVFYDIKQEKNKLAKNNHPNLAKFRPALFWDTSIDKIDWNRQKKAVINRVFERGNLAEKKEVLRFYGNDIIRRTLTANKAS